MSRIVRMGGLFALLCIVAGCQTARPLYYWGHYEALLYQTYRSPEKASAAEQVERLQEDLAKAAAMNLSPNPGLHAQLGLAYVNLGNTAAAVREFEQEKVLFPESAPFMDRLLARLKGNPAQ